jgi:amidase
MGSNNSPTEFLFRNWQEMLKQFGQLIFLVAQNTTGIGAAETAAIQQLDDLTAGGVEKVMRQHQLDAIVAPDSSSATVLAIGGLPGIAVPAGYDELGAPFGITFGGLKGYESRLIEIAYAFEQATKARKPPMFKN